MCLILTYILCHKYQINIFPGDVELVTDENDFVQLPDHNEGTPDDYTLPDNSDVSKLIPDDSILYQNQLADPEVAALFYEQFI